MWTITQIEPYAKGRVKVYLNDQFAFVLYKADIKRLQNQVDGFLFEPGSVIPDDLYQIIMSEILPKRAKLRALNLLKQHDKTRRQLEEKLREGLYPESVVSAAVEYVISYGYIDDERYVRSYASYRMNDKSRRQITSELISKGVASDTVTRVLDDLYYEEDFDEGAVIRRLAVKKLGSTYAPSGVLPSSLPEKELTKLYRFLAGKGYSFDKIRDSFSIATVRE